MSEAPKEEIKPCPFCGRPGDDWPGNNFIACGCIGDGMQSLDKWQNAFCWKELSKVKGELEKMKEENSMLERVQDNRIEWNQNTVALYGHRLKEKDSLLSKQGELLKEAYKQLSQFTFADDDGKIKKLLNELSTPSPEKERCAHGVWPGDSCFKCTEKEK